MNKIVFFVSSMQGGGAERVAALLSNQWCRSGDEVTLVLTYSGRGKCEYALDGGVRIVHLADLVDGTKKTAFTALARLLAMRRILREIEPNVVISFLHHVNVATLIASIGMGKRVVVSERVFPPHGSLGRVWSIFRHLLYPNAYAVVMQTERGLQWLHDTIPRASGVVIHNPCVYPLPSGEPRVRPNTVVGAETNIVLAAGRLVKQKNFEFLIKAFSDAVQHDSDWELIIVGSGELRDELQSVARAHGVGSSVHLIGRVGNMDEWYRRAAIYAMTSIYEGFPNTLAEALSYGVPAISLDCPTGPSDLIAHESNGFLLPENSSPHRFGGVLKLLMEDAPLRKQFARKAIEIKARNNVIDVANRWRALFQ